ncbi:hypothetical protein [Ancylobacter lacus]|uniref:hypothetical protein n=1 Tax=Ancylobacter lacus TaxID=2579970 RepID=UPI001BCBAE6E|nr:hypothetical protein [Ancylobacter lacus]MBS7538893.1 hypothetical protein [Ancylobacter lacus]
MERISKWLGARPHRPTVINLIMLSALLAIISSASLYGVIGGGAVLLAGSYFLFRVVNRTFASGDAMNFYQIALLWIPGVLAICLALVALLLVITNSAASLAYALGAFLFTAELAMLTLAGADLSPDPAPHPVAGGAI